MFLADQQWCPTSVQVTVLQARGLRIKGKSGTNDAYAVMQVGKEKYQTSVVEKSVAPVWREEAAFDLPPLQQGEGGGGGGGTERSTLHVQVLHRALVGPDKLLGQAVINLLQLSDDKTRNKTEWFKLLDKTSKADKDRGEVLVDIQFLRNNMTASMFDLSAAGKSKSRLGKFKDKVRGKKKETDAASTVVPSFSQVLTDSEEEGNGDDEVPAGKDEKKKKLKMKSLFSPKSNLQRNMSQSMSVLPAKNSSLSGSQSSSLNVDSSEGKKKFKFMIHKRSGSSDSKESSSGHQKHGAAEQSNLCINGSHVYCEEPQSRTSRIGSNFSLTSSGHGSMEDVPESSPPSVDSLRAVRQYSPWMEEEEETTKVENIEEDVGELRREEEERIGIEEERRSKEVEEERVRRQELERLTEEKKRQEEEKRRAEEERIKREEEEEKIRREEEERAQAERRKQEEEERVRREKEECERLAEENRRLEEQERRTIEEEEKRLREEGERLRMEEEAKMRHKEEHKLAEEKRRLEEERIRIEEEKIRKVEEERAQEERRRREEEEMVRRQEEEEMVRRQEKELEEKRRLEEERRRIEEEKVRKEEKEREQEERRRREEEEMVRRQEKEHEEKRRLEEQERRQRKEEEIIKEKERRQEQEEEKARREKDEFERLVEETKKQEEEERKKIEEEERIKREEEERIRVEEEERVRRREEELEKLAEQKRTLEEQERRRIEEEEKRQRAERSRKEEEKMRKEEEERVRRQEKEEVERLAEEKRRREEEERRRTEEEKVKREEDERIRKEEDERAQEEKRQEERVRKDNEEMERLAEEKRRLEEQEMKITEKEERVRMEEKAEKESKEEQSEKEKLAEDADEQKRRENDIKHKVAATKSKVAVESPADVTSTNPFDENLNNSFEELHSSSAGPDSSTAKVSTVRQRCQSAESSVGSKTVSSDEKDLISSQREKRPAPQPPRRNQAERQSQKEQDRSTPHLAQINKHSKDKDVKTISVLPQRSVQIIAPLSRSPTETKNTQSLPQSSTTKRPAPSRPHSVEEGPSSEPKTDLPSDDKISNECGSEAKQKTVYGLNPFEDDEDENEFTAQDDATTSGKTGSIQWPPAVSQGANEGATSKTKIKSSKVAHAPPLPTTKAATSTTLISQNTEGGHVIDETGVMIPDNRVTHACVSESVSPLRAQEFPSAGEEASGKKEGPTTGSRRLQPVKPLNPLEQQSVSVVGGGKDNKSTGSFCGDQKNTKVNETGLKGPYSQLTQEELISLVLKQKKELSERDKKISELEQYIDNLLVRVIEEQPSILMSMNSLKKSV